MGKKEEQKKIKQLLVEAITLLCRDGLQYETKFTVEALIGITLDDNDVVLININESFCNKACSDPPVSIPRHIGDNHTSLQNISIKNENYDEQTSFNNEELETGFKNHESDINEDTNFLNTDRNNLEERNNSEECQNQYGTSDISENQLSEKNMLYIKSESMESGEGSSWMMNNNLNEFGNIELSENINCSQQQTPQSYESRPSPYSFQIRRQRGRGRPSFRSMGQQRVRPIINQNNFISSQHNTLQESLMPLEVLKQLSTHQTSTLLALKKKLSSPKPDSFLPFQQPTILPEMGTTEDSNLLESKQSLFKHKSTKSSPQCWVCCRTFCSSQALKNHVDVKHLNKMAYKCSKCGECFKWRTGLCKHRRDLCPFGSHENSSFLTNSNSHNVHNDDFSNGVDNKNIINDVIKSQSLHSGVSSGNVLRHETPNNNECNSDVKISSYSDLTYESDQSGKKSSEQTHKDEPKKSDNQEGNENLHHPIESPEKNQYDNENKF